MKTESRAEQERIRVAYQKRKRIAAGEEGYFGYENPAHLYRLHERFNTTLQLLKAEGFHPLTSLHVLDVGCGDGNMLRQFLQWGAQPEHIAGIELRPEPIEKARSINPKIDFHCGSATELPYPNAAFDLVCQHTVFTSILDAGMKQTIATEMDRVLKSGGAVLWYDFFYNNPTNPDVQGVKKSEIEALFPGYRIHLQKITLVPPIARRIPRILLPTFYPVLAVFPFFRTHYLGLLIKRLS